jgi:hypothetical protein
VQRLSGRGNVRQDDGLHLAVSMRSFRAENVSAFVKAVLDGEVDSARKSLRRFVDRYPIAVTRNLLRAKQWVREHARGTGRYGLVASSGAQRLKPHAIDVRVNVNPVHSDSSQVHAPYSRQSFEPSRTALWFGTEGRWFKSSRPDQQIAEYGRFSSGRSAFVFCGRAGTVTRG